MDIENIDINELERIPLLTVERVELEEGTHATISRFTEAELSLGAIISAVTNIISSFIDYCPENMQNEVEEHIYSEILRIRNDRFDNMRTIRTED